MDAPMNTLKGLRQRYHTRLQQTIWGIASNGVPSNADMHNKGRVAIARGMLEGVDPPPEVERPNPQTSGSVFTELTLAFLRDTFLLLEPLRPGSWTFSSSQIQIGIAAFYQYEHLALLQELLKNLEQDSSTATKDLRAMFSGGYLITPDITIGRKPISDAPINEKSSVITSQQNIARHTPLRKANNGKELLHASISCKWTFRSDRAQNARTEALNLIRNRKGHTPHIVVVTGEPLPARLGSLAMGTGDIDCLYHMALTEMEQAVNAYGDETSQELLDTLIRGRRLRDISDLPFDLAI